MISPLRHSNGLCKAHSPDIVSVKNKSLTYNNGIYNAREELHFNPTIPTSIQVIINLNKNNKYRKIITHQNKISYFWNGDSFLNQFILKEIQSIHVSFSIK